MTKRLGSHNTSFKIQINISRYNFFLIIKHQFLNETLWLQKNIYYFLKKHNVLYLQKQNKLKANTKIILKWNILLNKKYSKK